MVLRSAATGARHAAALANGLVADDGQRQCWATIRSGLGAGLQEALDLSKQWRAKSWVAPSTLLQTRNVERDAGSHTSS
jgi:hypothetical protein